MLTQYCLELVLDAPGHPRAEWAYRLYAALLEQAPQDFGDAVHREQVTPVSQYLVPDGADRLRWTVNLLGTESEEALSGVLDRLEALTLEKDRVRLAVRRRERRTVPDVEALLELAGERCGPHHLRFETATAFKSRGRYLNLPTTRLIVQSLIKKWNGCILDCPIDDTDGQGMEALASGLRIRAFCLHDRMYYLKGYSIPGFTGELTLENRLDGFQRQLADALFLFGEFAGVGIKTALGMGGLRRLGGTPVKA